MWRKRTSREGWFPLRGGRNRRKTPPNPGAAGTTPAWVPPLYVSAPAVSSGIERLPTLGLPSRHIRRGTTRAGSIMRCSIQGVPRRDARARQVVQSLPDAAFSTKNGFSFLAFIQQREGERRPVPGPVTTNNADRF